MEEENISYRNDVAKLLGAVSITKELLQDLTIEDETVGKLKESFTDYLVELQKELKDLI
jgi:hypothetical protein